MIRSRLAASTASRFFATFDAPAIAILPPTGGGGLSGGLGWEVEVLSMRRSVAVIVSILALAGLLGSAPMPPDATPPT